MLVKMSPPIKQPLLPEKSKLLPTILLLIFPIVLVTKEMNVLNARRVIIGDKGVAILILLDVED